MLEGFGTRAFLGGFRLAVYGDEVNVFKVCSCSSQWGSRKEFLEDPQITLCGYQVSFHELRLGWFLFDHAACGTTLALKVGDFVDLYDGPIFQERKTDGPECQKYCLVEGVLARCPAKCECAYVREVMQIIQHHPRLRTPAPRS